MIRDLTELAVNMAKSEMAEAVAERAAQAAKERLLELLLPRARIRDAVGLDSLEPVSPEASGAATREKLREQLRVGRLDDRQIELEVRADLFAGEVAAALQAEKLIHLTDVEGIKGPGGELISTLSQGEARRLVAAGVIEGGMLPKVESALQALASAPPRPTSWTAIPHAILLEIFTREGIGAEIVL